MTTNRFKAMSFADLTREHGRLLGAPYTEQGKFEVMDLCEAMMDYHDTLGRGNDLLRENIRMWVGRIQHAWGLQ